MGCDVDKKVYSADDTASKTITTEEVFSGEATEEPDVGFIKRMYRAYSKKSQLAQIAISFIIIMMLFAVVVGSNLLYIKYETGKENDAKAKEELTMIEESYNDGDYYFALVELEDYEKMFSEGRINREWLSEEFYGETIHEQYYNKIIESWINRIDAGIRKHDVNNLKADECDAINELASDMATFISRFSDGVKYRTSSGEEKQCNPKKEYADLQSKYRYHGIVFSFDIGDKNERTSAIDDMKSFVQNSNNNSELIKKGKDIIPRMIALHPATDFKVTGGSSNITAYGTKNYGWTCPYCGYHTSHAGAPMALMESLQGHYYGEVYNYKSAITCAGKWVGGCGDISTYELKITFE